MVHVASGTGVLHGRIKTPDRRSAEKRGHRRREMVKGEVHNFSRGSIPRNIMSLALPMTAAQLINVLYSVVDRVYLGRLPGHLALTGLGLTIPIVSIIMGFATCAELEVRRCVPSNGDRETMRRRSGCWATPSPCC